MHARVQCFITNNRQRSAERLRTKFGTTGRDSSTLIMAGIVQPLSDTQVYAGPLAQTANMAFPTYTAGVC